MKSETRFQILVSVAALSLSMLTGYAASQTASSMLASPESFVAIADTETRSAAIFTELGKGFIEGNHGEPGQFVVEKAFAER